MKKLCIYTVAFYPKIGGLEQISLLIAKGAAINNIDVEVVTTTNTNSAADDKQFPFKITRTNNILQKFKSFQQSDVILFMNISLYALPLACLSGRPIVLSHHIDYSFPGIKNAILSSIKRSVTYFFINISVSQYIANKLKGKSTVIPNAYDNNVFIKPIDFQRTKQFVFCGRLVSDKGVDLLLESLAIVVNYFPNIKLTIIGDGPEKLKLQQLAKKLNIEGNISFSGFLTGDKLCEELINHNCMIIPSIWNEPFGIVALEGIACCDTVIASSRGGLPEAVGDCGLIIDPTISNLSNAMMDVMHAINKGATLPGQPSDLIRTKHLNKHTQEQIVKRYIDVCLQTLKN